MRFTTIVALVGVTSAIRTTPAVETIPDTSGSHKTNYAKTEPTPVFNAVKDSTTGTITDAPKDITRGDCVKKCAKIDVEKREACAGLCNAKFGEDKGEATAATPVKEVDAPVKADAAAPAKEAAAPAKEAAAPAKEAAAPAKPAAAAPAKADAAAPAKEAAAPAKADAAAPAKAAAH